MELASNSYSMSERWCSDLEQPSPMGYIDGKPIYEGDSTWLCCLLEDNKPDESFDIPF